MRVSAAAATRAGWQTQLKRRNSCCALVPVVCRFHAGIQLFFRQVDMDLFAPVPQFPVFSIDRPRDSCGVPGSDRLRRDFPPHFYNASFGYDGPLPDFEPPAENGAHADNGIISDESAVQDGAAPDMAVLPDHHVADDLRAVADI